MKNPITRSIHRGQHYDLPIDMRDPHDPDGIALAVSQSVGELVILETVEASVASNPSHHDAIAAEGLPTAYEGLPEHPELLDHDHIMFGC